MGRACKWKFADCIRTQKMASGWGCCSTARKAGCILGGSEWKTYYGRKNEPGEQRSDKGDEHTADVKLTEDGAHFWNFIEAVRANKRELQTADISGRAPIGIDVSSEQHCLSNRPASGVRLRQRVFPRRCRSQQPAAA